MPEEENKKLRDLVSETLQTKGVLGRIQAEIRASVFLALEEQNVFKDKSPFINRQLKEFLKSSDGITVISLVREFLEFFNLEFAAMVFDPETQAGLDYNYEGRLKLANMLNINDNDKRQPLLGHILKLSKSYLNAQSEKDDRLSTKETIQSNINSVPEINDSLNATIPPFVTDDIFNGTRNSNVKPVQDKLNVRNSTINKTQIDFNHKAEERLQEKIFKESSGGGASLTSLSNLPPIGKPTQSDQKEDKESYDLKTLLDISSDKHYDDDFLSSESDHIKKGSKIETGSEESEIEEEISGISNISAQPDDNTNDISISKASGLGDYMENL